MNQHLHILLAFGLLAQAASISWQLSAKPHVRIWGIVAQTSVWAVGIAVLAIEGFALLMQGVAQL